MGDNATGYVRRLEQERDELRERVRVYRAVSNHETLVAEVYRLEGIIKDLQRQLKEPSRDSELFRDTYYEGCLNGQMDERAAIVSWLRHQSEPGTSAVRPIGSIADQIERGQHLAGDDA